jgi:hypothetical protein
VAALEIHVLLAISGIVRPRFLWKATSRTPSSLMAFRLSLAGEATVEAYLLGKSAEDGFESRD